MFVISNGERYIAQCSTGLKPTHLKEEAIQFKNYDKANAFMMNMPKSFRNLGYHIEGKAEVVQPQPKPSEHKKVIIKRDMGYINEIKTGISNINSFISDLKQRKTEAEKTVVECEKSMIDYLHNAEFYNQNACNGYKKWHELGEIMRKRREAKDTIIAVTAILEDNNFDGILSQKTINRVSGLENRVYAVRELDDIFPD